jgi:transposase
MNKQHITLSKEDREYCKNLISKGEGTAKIYRRAIALLELDRGKSCTEVAKTVSVSRPTITSLKKNYKEEGLKCLEDKPRSGRPVKFDGKSRAKITALACSEAPEGYSQWSLRLLADKAVELEYCEPISHTQVGNILKKTT